MNNLMKSTALAALAVGSFVAVNAAGGGSASALAPCADSNGSAPGGSVYFTAAWYRSGAPAPCTVTPPQRLHITGLTAAECATAGGSYQASPPICWDIDL
ncbi:hypothetical protein [Desertimonas flava]|uniref:hypothetical protein n=1 Tax=Desertimonas flava TaxID=2064846 RepID=UPI000E3523EB|nr:hypothetical protein [Desertimonas flava]